VGQCPTFQKDVLLIAGGEVSRPGAEERPFLSK